MKNFLITKSVEIPGNGKEITPSTSSISTSVIIEDDVGEEVEVESSNEIAAPNIFEGTDKSSGPKVDAAPEQTLNDCKTKKKGAKRVTRQSKKITGN